MSDVEQFLLHIGLEKYLQAFIDEEVDSVKAMEGLTDDNLKDLGLKSMGARGKLRAGLKDWQFSALESQAPALTQPAVQALVPFAVKEDEHSAMIAPDVAEISVLTAETPKLDHSIITWFTDLNLNWTMDFAQDFERLAIGTSLSNYKQVIEHLRGRAMDDVPDKDGFTGDVANAMQMYFCLVNKMSLMLKTVKDIGKGYSQLGYLVSAVFDGLGAILMVRCSLDHTDPVDLSEGGVIDFLCEYFLAFQVGALPDGVDHFISVELPIVKKIDDIVAVINAKASGEDGVYVSVAHKMKQGVETMQTKAQLAHIRPDPNKAKLRELEALEKEIEQKLHPPRTFPLLREYFKGEVEEMNKAEYLASLVEEVASAIDIKVKLCVPSTHQVIILIGPTGAGKSTLGNWILGNTVTAVSKEIAADEDDWGSRIEWRMSVRRKGDLPMFAVGSVDVSETFLPNVFILPGQKVVLMDFPGFLDTNSCATRLGIDLGFRMVLKRLGGRAHVVAVMQAIGFTPTNSRAGPGVAHLQKIQDHLPIVDTNLNRGLQKVTPELGARCMYAITGCDGKFAKGDPQQLWDTFVSKCKGVDEDLMVTMNKHLLNQKGGKDKTPPMTPAMFVQKVLQITHVPKRFESDCLANDDVEKLTQFLSTASFATFFYSKLHPEAVDPNKNIPKSSWDWSNLLAQSKVQREQTERITIEIGNFTQAAKDGQCPFGKLVPAIGWLSKQDQPRLNLAILELETMVMKKILASCTAIIESSKAFIDQMWKDAALMTVTVDSDLWTEYKNAVDATEEELKAIAEDLGYEGTKQLVDGAKVASAVLVTIGGALLVGTLCSATFFAIPGMVTIGWVATVVGVGSGGGLALKKHEAQKAVRLIMLEHIAIVKATGPIGQVAKKHMVILDKAKEDNTLRCRVHGQ